MTSTCHWKVIKAQLDAQPDGELPVQSAAYPAPRLVPVGPEHEPAREAGVGAPTPVRLTREGTCGSVPAWPTTSSPPCAGPESSPSGPGGFFDEHSVVIAQCAAALGEYGVEPRHLRAFRSAADRQSDLIAQIAGPVGLKAGRTGARDRADDLAREVAALAITLHTSLIKSAVRDVLDR